MPVRAASHGAEKTPRVVLLAVLGRDDQNRPAAVVPVENVEATCDLLGDCVLETPETQLIALLTRCPGDLRVALR